MEAILAPDASATWRSLLKSQCYFAGRWIDGDDRIAVADPATGQLIGTVPRLRAGQLRTAIAAAETALPQWRALLPRERGELLMAWRASILAHREALAALMTMEQGKPLAEARGEIEYGAEFIRWFAEEANRLDGDVIPSHLARRKLFVQREPVGVVGLVTPWNFPSAMLTRKAGAALAAGCTAVAVPSIETPFSALALAALAEESGLPGGVFSVVTGDPEDLVGELCRNDAVRALSFTGSTRVGRIIAGQCAATVKRVSLELGGHAPFLVFADADLDLATAAAVAAKYQTSGQDCLAANRIFVQRPLYAAFVDAFGRLAAGLKVADGFAAGAEIGPLINKTALAKVERQVEDALAKGARLITGGRVHPAGDLFYAPTVLADVTPDMLIMREETFGPVAAILPFDDEDAVTAAANTTDYGLVAYVFTRDLSRAHRLGDRLEYGMVAINTARLTGAPVPFGGIKQSGLGREGSQYGIHAFTELKYLCIAV